MSDDTAIVVGCGEFYITTRYFYSRGRGVSQFLSSQVVGTKTVMCSFSL